MNTLELVVTERNRLVRLSIIVSIVAFALATWARDPGLNITTPFSGPEAGNITVGHAVLIGHPVLCVIFLVLVAQISRYKSLVGRLAQHERDHLDWKLIRAGSGNIWADSIQYICESFRWFAMVAIPAIASGFLLDAQTDFRNTESKQKYSYSNMFDGELWDEFYNIKPSYLSLRKETCGKNAAQEIFDACRREQAILQRMPTLYQPYNFLFGMMFQVIVIGALIWTAIRYFGSDNTKKGEIQPDMMDEE